MSAPTKEQIVAAASLMAKLRNERLGSDGLFRMGRKTARTLKEKYGDDVYRRMRLGLPLIPVTPTEDGPKE